MYIEKVPNRNSPPAVLLRESYREGDQVKKRTLANLSKLPDDIIDNLKLALKGATLSMTEGIPNHFEVIRSLPHGHVMAILETIKKLGLDKIISEKSSRIRNLVVAMISDSTTLSGQIEKVRKGWGIENVVWVSDRGILTNSKIKELVKPIEGLDYIT
ncbi:MAG: tail length tape measure protein, partial [Microcystis sp.]